MFEAKMFVLLLLVPFFVGFSFRCAIYNFHIDRQSRLETNVMAAVSLLLKYANDLKI